MLCILFQTQTFPNVAQVKIQIDQTMILLLSPIAALNINNFSCS